MECSFSFARGAELAASVLRAFSHAVSWRGRQRTWRSEAMVPRRRPARLPGSNRRRSRAGLFREQMKAASSSTLLVKGSSKSSASEDPRAALPWHAKPHSAYPEGLAISSKVLCTSYMVADSPACQRRLCPSSLRIYAKQPTGAEGEWLRGAMQCSEGTAEPAPAVKAANMPCELYIRPWGMSSSSSWRRYLRCPAHRHTWQRGQPTGMHGSAGRSQIAPWLRWPCP